MANISLQHLDKIYDNNVQAVYDFNLEVKDGAMKLVADPELGPNGQEWHCHDILSGKAAHGADIFENEGRLMELHKDETFKARKAHYTAVCAPTPAPSKQ